ncbi:hypothetical protein PENTCL1PPCAC_4173, partial [Pristionchus entomophagus]
LISFTLAQDVRRMFKNGMRQQQVRDEFREFHRFSSLIDQRSDSFYSFNDLLDSLSGTEITVSIISILNRDLEFILREKQFINHTEGFFKDVLMPMKDSAGKIGPAILKGHAYFAGHYSECARIDFKISGRTRHFGGAYFKVGVDQSMQNNDQPGACATIDGFAILWYFGMCFPSSCSSVDLMKVLRPENGTASFPNPVCELQKSAENIRDLDAGFWITVSIMSAIVLLCATSGLIDFYFSDVVKDKPISKSFTWRFIMACSLYANVSSIFDVSGANKEGQIAPIHCMRFFSMCWVVMCHLTAWNIPVIANLQDFIDLTKDITTEVINNGFFSVDTFYFMGGVLLTFLWFKNYERNPKATNSLPSWIMFYVHRILRLSPAFYMVVIFYTFGLQQMLRDTPYSMIPTDNCYETWWVELLYLHNFIDHDKLYLGYSWYLASDMQMYLFTPLFILPMAIKPIFGLIVAALVFIISTGMNIALVYHYHWPANQGFFGPRDPDMTNFDNYNMYMYDSPLIRCQIYIMGLSVGWFLQTRKRLKINWFVNIVGWCLAIALLLTPVLGLHDQTNGEAIPLFWRRNIFVRAMYSAFSRVSWGLGLSWVLISCYYGYGGPINTFMSWHIWIPFGRLTYCGYLIHIPVFIIFM